MAWLNRFKQRKAFKKDVSEDLISILQYGGRTACQKIRQKK